MYQTFFLLNRKASLAFLVLAIGFLISGCGVKKADQEKALLIIHQSEPNFEQLAQDVIKSDGAFKETKRGSFEWKFSRKSVSDQIFARYGYWDNHPKILIWIGSILGEIFGVNPWPEDEGVYIALTVDLSDETVRLMTEWEHLNWFP